MKKYILIIFCALIIAAAGVFIPGIIKYRQTISAMGALTYQIGLTNVQISKCITSGTPPVCTGAGTGANATTYCNTKTAAMCSGYSYVSGTPAGGMGMDALFMDTVIAKIGLTPGGQLLAGGTSPVLMDNGVAASVGGASLAVEKKANELLDKFNFIIAGIKGK